MVTWALVNIVLSGLALLFALVNRGAPHRLRFLVCFLALLAWLVPWSLVPAWMPDLLSLDLWQVEQRMIQSSARVTTMPLILIDARSVPLVRDVTLIHVPLLVLSTLLLSGLCLFLWQVGGHHWKLRRLARDARDGTSLLQQSGIQSNVPVLLQTDIGGAFSSGILKPKIWVHVDLTDTPQLPTLLRHELTHIQQHDNAYLLAITLVERLFWWNPLVRVLGSNTRHLQELSCDERCRDCNADYAVDLAALMLADLKISRSRAPEPLLLSANIFNKPNLNIQRLKVLQRSYQMKPRHIVSSIATAALAIVSVGLATAQDQQTPPEDNVIFFRHAAEGSVGVVGGATWEAEAFDPESAVVPGERYSSVFGMHATNGVDQFMKMERLNDETVVTFSFTDAALPFVLGPLADMLGGPVRMVHAVPATAIPATAGAVPLPAPGQGIEVRRLEVAPPAPGAASGEVIVAAPAAVRTFELESSEGKLVHFAGPTTNAMAAQAAGTPSMEFPISPNLVIEDDSARVRQVTVSGESMSVEEALDAIAEASGCNIFKDGETVVVDYCDAQ